VIRDKLSLKLKKLPDLERMLSRIYTYSVKQSVKAIYIDIAIINRLDEFYTLLNNLKKLKDVVLEIFTDDIVKRLRSERLKALVTFT
jgi:DNA mismatch repair protein MSH6